VKVLCPVSREQNAPLCPQPGQVPLRAMAVGVGIILDSRQCLLLATGEEKAEIVAKAVEVPVTSMVSAFALQLHPSCRVILDEAAGAGCKARMTTAGFLSMSRSENRSARIGIEPAFVRRIYAPGMD